MKQKIKHANILRIIDVENTQLTPGTLQFFKKEAEEIYTDRKLNEHIYNISDVFDEYREQDFDQDILNELESLLNLVTRKNAAYLRIVYN